MDEEHAEYNILLTEVVRTISNISIFAYFLSVCIEIKVDTATFWVYVLRYSL